MMLSAFSRGSLNYLTAMVYVAFCYMLSCPLFLQLDPSVT